MAMPEPTTIVGGATAIGLIGILWQRITAWASTLMRVFVVRVNISHRVAMAMQLHLRTNFKTTGMMTHEVISNTLFVRSRNRHQMVLFETIPNGPSIYWRGWRPLVLERTLNQSQFASVSFLRGTFKLDDLLLEAANGTNAKNFSKNREGFSVVNHIGRLAENNQRIRETENGKLAHPTGPDELEPQELESYRCIGHAKDDLGKPTDLVPPRHRVCLPAGAEDIFDDAQRWMESEDWYRQRSIPWRRGFLLVGPPGTGKSTLVRCLGQELNARVHMFDLSTMSNEDMQHAWRDCLRSVPCIVLFEDIDAVFDGRKNLSPNPAAMSFDCLLNCVSGVQNADGILTIFTANNVAKLDKAIYNERNDDTPSRPGRVDRVVAMDYLTEEGYERIANRILEGSNIDRRKLIRRGMDNPEGMTGAQFEELCTRESLREFWERKA